MSCITKSIGKISRRYQYAFRKNIIKRDKKCLITNAPPIVCEAAHIVELKNHKEFPDIDFYDPFNGILLRSDIHKLFDLNYWYINPEEIIKQNKKNTTFEIKSNIKLLDDDIVISELDNKIINIPNESINYFFNRYL